MKILHVLDHSLPYFSGYSFRSDYILRGQRRLGLHPVVVTSPKHEDFEGECETIDGIDCHRVRWPESSAKFQNITAVRQAACVAALAKKIRWLAAELKIDVIHAHSPSLNGLAAARVASELDLPWIYELRYYDEDAAVDRGKIKYNSLRYRLARRLEQSALQQATRVTTISQALRADLIAREVDSNKILEIPNGVDTDRFRPREPDAELVAKHDLAGRTIIGFIGSFYFYEGLDRLIDAVLLLLTERRDVKLLLVGEGEAEEMLRGCVPDQWREHFIFAGKAAHADAPRYYSAMDILVYPRISSRLTELTTPLKPLEAMAMKKAVVGSDVGGLRELISDGETGFLVKPENPPALAKRLSGLVEDEAMRRAAGRRAREFVVRERDWEQIVARYLAIYQETTTQGQSVTTQAIE